MPAPSRGCSLAAGLGESESARPGGSRETDGGRVSRGWVLTALGAHKVGAIVVLPLDHRQVFAEAQASVGLL